MYYATEFLKDLNIGGSGGAYFQTILIGVCSFIATFISLFTIDKFGRKPLMVIGTIGTGINMFLVGVSIYTGNVTYMTLVYIFLYIMFFGFTLGPCYVGFVVGNFPEQCQRQGNESMYRCAVGM